ISAATSGGMRGLPEPSSKTGASSTIVSCGRRETFRKREDPPDRAYCIAASAARSRDVRPVAIRDQTRTLPKSTPDCARPAVAARQGLASWPIVFGDHADDVPRKVHGERRRCRRTAIEDRCIAYDELAILHQKCKCAAADGHQQVRRLFGEFFAQKARGARLVRSTWKSAKLKKFDKNLDVFSAVFLETTLEGFKGSHAGR